MSLIFPAIKDHLVTVSWCLALLLPSTTAVGQSRRCEVDRYYQDKVDTWAKRTNPVLHLQPRAVTNLPVVVHVVWSELNENIPRSEVEKQIDRLNLEFNNPHTGRKSVPEEFRSAIGNPAIRFCLASKDPDGNPHPGVINRQTSIRHIGSVKDASGKYIIHSPMGSPAWDPTRFINIWVGKMENVFGRSTIGGTIYPAEEDGLVIDPSQFGVDYSRNLIGRTLVHEMGHYLGLQHLWGSRTGECTEEDGIADTPVQDGPYFGCPVYPQRSCGNNNMFMNFMDFADDLCMDLFTKDQVTRMHQTLATYRGGLLIPGGDCQASTGNLMLPQLKYYYNTSKRTITLQANSIPESAVYIRISNILGQELYTGTWDMVSIAELSTQSWVTGIYLINLRYNEERRTIKLFIP